MAEQIADHWHAREEGEQLATMQQVRAAVLRHEERIRALELMQAATKPRIDWTFYLVIVIAVVVIAIALRVY